MSIPPVPPPEDRLPTPRAARVSTLDERFAAVVAETELYGLTWWAEPASTAARRLARDASLRGRLRARRTGLHRDDR